MNILIRTDASVQIGTGHVMRCLTIAHEMWKRGHQITFAMRKLQGHLATVVEKQGFHVEMLQYEGDFQFEKDVKEIRQLFLRQDYDICIIDHYGIDAKWEKIIRPFVKKLIVIDDLANRSHDCDILLDQNVVNNYEHRYDHLVPKYCKKLLGPKYLILREEFTRIRKKISPRKGVVRNLLIFMGGSDPTRETLKVMKAFETFDGSFNHVDVVVGQANPDRETVRTYCEKFGFAYHCQIDYLASLMAKADFSIGAGGSTTWERCYVGLPSSSTIVADNQVEATKMAAQLGVVINLGWHEKVTSQTYEKLLNQIIEQKEPIQKMSMKGLQLTENPDGPNPWVNQMLEMW
ncbi:UDP-2,4-diacetamido-2,4,6-trideoxy-beta-L-altropyranose hydrolase [Thermaerobacillus caldiproteolyticus]|uniref:UDP-2,4-diacetamido-2,4, 6-trideoxy-beta-L-altropyranose hydrolase n=1 Tax=Thermaerobacillus caldiproteolyticus TaxID=247480 RepID=UPI00188CCE79|nr:UDP-2,4-diacetamido-2,4,6-trideoxy-beta-L-altropyranose hydrolase [Anoxybacillus caldiproteolyticus]QPA30690.1 UDP-2,4-diacetamido-2,4,6-trideoxy-beta-L-altropyranose hydrolase [Anoxybacillus caldiproteolyticus]